MSIYNKGVKVAGSSGKVGLIANISYYINGTTGLDTNDGLSLGSPLRYIQTAINKIPKDLGGFIVTINIASWVGNNYDAILVKDFQGGLIIFQGGSTNVEALDYRIPYAYVEDCQEVMMIGLTFNGVLQDWEGSLDVRRTIFTGTNLVANNDLTENNAIGLRFQQCPWIELSGCLIYTRETAVSMSMGTTGRLSSMTYTGNFSKVIIGLGGTYIGSLADVSDNTGTVLAIGKGVTSDIATAFDTALTASVAQTTMLATDILPVVAVASTDTRQITWANFVIALKGAIADASQSVSGWLTALDKKKLDGMLKTQSVIAQSGFATDTYLTGSYIKFPFVPVVGTKYRCIFDVTKTNVGTATPIINIRIGTAGSVVDTSRGILTFGVGTAAADAGLFEVIVVFRTVGGTTAAVIQSISRLTSNLATTGLSNAKKAILATSAGFDSTVASLGIGLSYNGGTSAVHTVQLVAAELVM